MSDIVKDVHPCQTALQEDQGKDDPFHDIPSIQSILGLRVIGSQLLEEIA